MTWISNSDLRVILILGKIVIDYFVMFSFFGIMFILCNVLGSNM